MYAMPLGEKLAFFQIILIDLSLAGDNAIVVGMAVAGLPQALRHRASSLGIGAAALLRACLALFALDILHLTGLTLAGGLLLLLVGWKLYRELRHRHKAQQVQTAGLIAEPLVTKTLGQAILQIVVADISMSLDNVLAVAGAAHGKWGLLLSGMALSVILMGFASSFVVKLVARNHRFGYVGIAVIFYTAINMIHDGMPEILSLMQ